MDLLLIKSENLENDEFHIECEIRRITTGELPDRYRLLDEQLVAEQGNLNLTPKNLHALAKTLPEAEVSICILKLQNLQTRLLSKVSSGNVSQEEVTIINSRLRHLLGRTQRIASMPTVQPTAAKLSQIIGSLLGICKKIYEKSQTVDETLTEIISIHIDPSEVLDSLMNLNSVPGGPLTPTESTTKCETRNTAGVNITADENTLPPQSIANLDLPNISSIEASNITQSDRNTAGAHVNQQMPGPSTFNYFNPTPSNNLPAVVPPNPNISFIQPPIFNYPPPQPFSFHEIPGMLPRATHEQNHSKPVNMPNPFPYVHTFKMPVAQAPPTSTINFPSNKGSEVYPTKMDKWKLSFNGTDVMVEKFVFQVEHLASTNGISEQQLVNGLHLFLKGLASDHYWVMLQQNPNCTWQELKASLLYRFKIRRSDIEIRQSLDNRKQKLNESFIEFYYSIHELAQPLTYPLTEREILEILKKNMRRELKIHLAGRFINTISELLSVCTNVEDVWKNADYAPGSAQPRFRPHQPNQINSFSYAPPFSDEALEDPNNVERSISEMQIPGALHQTARNPSRKSPLTCWNCQRIDHFWWQCDIPLRIFCFGCGLPDVMLPHCPSCTREGNWKPGMGRPGFHHSQTQVQKPNIHPCQQQTNSRQEKPPPKT